MITLRYLKKLMFILMIFILASCKEDGEVKLELENKEIYFVELPEIKTSYQSEADRTKALNILTYTFTNTTNKKFLFVFDQHEVLPSFDVSPETLYYGYVGFIMKDYKDSIKDFYPILPNWIKEGDLHMCQSYKDSIKRSDYNKLGINADDFINVDNYFNNAVVVGPGETKTFKATLHLPLIKEIDNRLEKGGLYYPNLEENNVFELFYYCKAKELKESLPQYIQEELDKNEVEIFDGKLTANTVKLKKR